MSLVIDVYLDKIDDEIISKWIGRMNNFDMECEIHPDFSFEDHNGFLPFRVKLMNSKNKDLIDQDLLSGFEIYKSVFDFKKVLQQNEPKKTFFQRLLNKPTDALDFVSPKIDSKLEKCKWLLTFKWGSNNSLELRMASLSSAIITKLTNGVCSYPADDIWFENKTIVENAFKESLEYEDSLQPAEWKIFQFQGWDN